MTIALIREQEVFAIKETTAGTLQAPTAGSFIIAAGVAKVNQPESYTDSAEIINSRDVIDRFRDRTPPATWSIPLYLRPSGSAGTAPQEAALLECLMGTETVSGGTSVTYSQALTKSTFSMWLKHDHTVFNCRGCTVDQATLALASKDGARLDMSGQGMQMGWAGTDNVNGTVSISATSVVVDDAKKYTVGALIEFVESGVVKNNSDSGYEVTAVNVATNTLTISPGAEEEIDDDSVIRGWLPTGTEVGAPVTAREGYVQIASSTVVVNKVDLTINDPAKFLDDEMTATGYVESKVEQTRDISGNISVYFDEDDLSYFYDGRQNTSVDMDIIIGSTAGSIITINLPYTSLIMPEEAESDPTLAISMPFKALGSSGEDSMSIVFT